MDYEQDAAGTTPSASPLLLHNHKSQAYEVTAYAIDVETVGSGCGRHGSDWPGAAVA